MCNSGAGCLGAGRAGRAVASWPGKRNALYAGAEGEQTAVAILDSKLSRLPRHIGRLPDELEAAGRVLGGKGVSIFDKQVCVQQFLRIFAGIGRGRLGAAEVNGVPVVGHDGRLPDHLRYSGRQALHSRYRDWQPARWVPLTGTV